MQINLSKQRDKSLIHHKCPNEDIVRAGRFLKMPFPCRYEGGFLPIFCMNFKSSLTKKNIQT